MWFTDDEESISEAKAERSDSVFRVVFPTANGTQVYRSAWFSSESDIASVNHEEAHKAGKELRINKKTDYQRKIVLDSLRLPSPPAYDLTIHSLSIGVPPPARLPVPIPAFLKKKSYSSELEQNILRDVDASCANGEMLAM